MKQAKSRPATFKAGCGRTWQAATPEPELAYAALEFGECPACSHRLLPEGGPSFCRLLPEGRAHPFAGLALLELAD